MESDESLKWLVRELIALFRCFGSVDFQSVSYRTLQRRRLSGPSRRAAPSVISLCNEPGIERTKRMKLRFLAMAMALAGVFAAQHAVAKTSSKTAMTKKHHHKKHKNKARASVQAPVMPSGSAVS